METLLSIEQSQLVRRLTTLMESKWIRNDLSGTSTIQHSLRVCEQLVKDGYPFKICLCGLLHDVLEDSEIEVPELRNLGVSDEVLQVLSYLTFTGGILRNEYIERIRTHNIARIVKIYDLRDNMNLMRLKKFNQSTYNRFMRYAKEYYYLVDTNKEMIE